MLDQYCSTLTDEAQLKLAIRLGKLALPVWNNYFKENPRSFQALNELITDKNRVNGGLEFIDVEFPSRALEKIERSLNAAKEKSPNNPIPLMKGDATLSPLLATYMQPLTNAKWDATFPQSVKLAFTFVFNILVWLLYRRKNAQFETHIYVSINQSSDVILRENILTVEQLNVIWYDYKNERRRDGEDADWENAFRVGHGESLDQEDIYRKIIGEKVVKGQCGPEVAKEVLRQMREEKKSYWNMLDEHVTGTSTTYSYDLEKQSYKKNEFDVIVGSFNIDTMMTEDEMLYVMAQQHLADLRDSGFEV